MSSPASPSKSITLGHNTVAGYVAQIIGATINLIFIPLYIHFLGAEAYGLVGFVAVLYAGLTFLDVGLSATLAREMARFRGGEYSAREIGKLIGTFEKIFAGMAIAFAVGVAIFSGFLARDWFKVHNLDPVIVQQAVCLMGLVVAVRWSLSFYRSGMLGLERIVWINVVSISASFVYCAVVLVILIFWPDVRLFFVCQLLAGVTELFIVRAALQNHLGRDAAITGFSRQILYEYGKFSLSVALVSSLWVAVMQTDRLVLSNVLPLQEFGYFVVATSAAFGVTLLYGPIGQALRPRMSYHAARGETKALQNLVLLASQVTFVVAAPLALTFALVPHSVLFSWTGSMVISNTVGAVLALYALGYLGAALVTPSYYLQLAMGNLRLQIIGRIAFVIVLVPTILFATWSYGMWGAGVVWSVENFIYLALWVPVMFRKDLPLVVVPWSKQILTQSAVLGAVYLGLSILGLDRWNGSSRLFDGLVAVCVWLAFSGIALALNRAVAKGALRTLRNIGNRVLPNTVRT